MHHSTTRRVIAIDADGVMFDYNACYPEVWKKAFGVELQEVFPNCYHAHHQYGVQFESERQKKDFFAAFDHDIWSRMSPLPGAVEATQLLHQAGFELVCVSSMPQRFQDSRLKNLHDVGIPIERIFATGRDEDGNNPKKDIIHELAPVHFVDDLLENFRGIHDGVNKVWIDYGKKDSPNVDVVNQGLHHTTHGSLLSFAQEVLSLGGDIRPQSHKKPF